MLIAHAKIGELLWKQSCPRGGIDGLCVTENEHARTCGTGTARMLTVTARDRHKRTEALAALAVAIADYERRPPNPDLEARHYYAQAKLVVVDDELETQLALALPGDLNFDPKKTAVRAASTKRFLAWLEQRQTTAAPIARKYGALLEIKDAATSIAVAARFGILTQSLASALVTGAIPRDVRTGAQVAERVNVYCDGMTEVIKPMETRATEAYATCLEMSSELSWFAESSTVCEHELTWMKPTEFPPAREPPRRTVAQLAGDRDRAARFVRRSVANLRR